MEGDIEEDSESVSEITENHEQGILKRFYQGLGGDTSGNILSNSENTGIYAEKRKVREDEDSDDDEGFITINRRRPKRLIRSDSTDSETNKRVDLEKNSEIHEVCVTSLNALPKQIAMAKMLRAENITGITRIKYKSTFKALIQFKSKEDAAKLLECHKIKENGYRCQLTQEMSVTYGLVRGVDLEMTEEELMEIFKSSAEILSIKRLKRLNPDGKWVDSESIRICFKNNTLPSYIHAYECRFRVERYVFPVTQCNGCWQFGHFLKFCPTKKMLCPKCGGDHPNCNIQDYTCLNCKGNHLVLDKTCPFYVREKSIRVIMSKEQVTYRRALQQFYESKEKGVSKRLTIEYSSNDLQRSTSQNGGDSYREKLINGGKRSDIVPMEQIIEEDSERSSGEMSTILQQTTLKIKNNNKKKTEGKRQISREQPLESDGEKSHAEKENTTRDEETIYKFEFMKLWLKIKTIILSKNNIEEKIISVLKVILGEVKRFLSGMFFNGKVFDHIIQSLNG